LNRSELKSYIKELPLWFSFLIFIILPSPDNLSTKHYVLVVIVLLISFVILNFTNSNQNLIVRSSPIISILAMTLIFFILPAEFSSERFFEVMPLIIALFLNAYLTCVYWKSSDTV